MRYRASSSWGYSSRAMASAARARSIGSRLASCSSSRRDAAEGSTSPFYPDRVGRGRRRLESLLDQALEVDLGAGSGIRLVASVREGLLDQPRDHLALHARLRQLARKPARPAQIVDQLRAGVRALLQDRKSTRLNS